MKNAAQQKSPPRETQGLHGLFAASIQAARMQVFTVTVFAQASRTGSTLPFCFQLKKKTAEKTKSQRAAPPREAKTCARKTCPKLHYIMWPYTTPRKAKGCAGCTLKPAGCIKTLCKISAHGVRSARSKKW